MKPFTCVDKIINSAPWRWLYKIQRFIMFATTAVMLVMLGAVVLARYVFHVDLYGYDEILLADSFWMYFFGASYAMCLGEHIKADILATILKPRTVNLTKIISGVLQTAINIVFIVLSYRLVVDSYTQKLVSSLWNLPYWFPQISIFISFIITGFYMAVYTLRDFNAYISPEKEG